jgi:hypothetical protein
MTDTQLLVLAGLIWIAPHVPKLQSLLAGMVLLIIASGRGLGWI